MFLCLGNPGSRYAETRHNVGFDFADAFAARCGVALRKPIFQPYRSAVLSIAGVTTLVCTPLTFMNRSGAVLPLIGARYTLQTARVVVVTDNMDLPPGALRFKRTGGPSTHNGLRSVIAALGTTDFPRLYIGVGRPQQEQTVVDHVLSAFSADDRRDVDAAIRRAVDSLAGASYLDMDTMTTLLNDAARA